MSRQRSTSNATPRQGEQEVAGRPYAKQLCKLQMNASVRSRPRPGWNPSQPQWPGTSTTTGRATKGGSSAPADS